MVFDELVLKKVSLRKRHVGVGGNSVIAPVFAPVFILLCLSRQLRAEVLGYIHHKKLTFILSIYDAYAFPYRL